MLKAIFKHVTIEDERIEGDNGEIPGESNTI
jgi:hypothetical protein